MLAATRHRFLDDYIKISKQRNLGLRSKVNVPLAAGEEWGNRWDFNPLVERHDIDFVRATLPNVGGITEMLKIAALCETHFVAIAPHFTGPISTAALVNVLAACDRVLARLPLLRALADHRLFLLVRK